MSIFDLLPLNGQKSFYGKAKVLICDNGDKTLLSYNTKILTIKANGDFIRHFAGWTQTTGKHIKAFADLNKAQFLSLPLEA